MYAAIATTRAKGRDHMRGIAYEDHPVMDEPVYAAAVEGIDADPVELEGSSPDDFLDARDDVFRLLLLFRVGVGPELKIDAVDIVRLLVEQGGLPRMEGRRKPCLLYTSPSPRDREKSRMPSSA